MKKNQVEYVFRKIAGEKQCPSCKDWMQEQELGLLGICSKCLPKMLIPLSVFNSLSEATRTLAMGKYINEKNNYAKRS